MDTFKSRRAVLRGAAAAGGLAAGALCAIAAPSLFADDGSPIRAFDLDGQRALAAFGDAQRLGARGADVVLIEAFDYNCHYCRGAAGPLDDVLARDAGLAVLLVHHPILSPASLAAAAVQRAVLTRYGAAPAAALHRAMLAAPGRMNGARARSLCADFGIGDLPPADIEAATADVTAMRRRAAALGMRFTPTFCLGDTAFVGWPGPRTLETMVAMARRCGQVRCG